MKGVDVYIIGTEKCNLNCPYCSNVIEKKPQRYDPDKISESVDKLIAATDIAKTMNRVDISGGEPLLDIPFIHRIASKFPKDHLNMTLFSNCHLLTEEIDSFLQALCYKLRYCIGVDNSEQKGIKKILSNPYMDVVFKNDRASLIYVIDDETDWGKLRADMFTVVEKRIPTMFTYNYDSPNKSLRMIEAADHLGESVKETGFVPRLCGLYGNACTRSSIHRNGELSGCEQHECDACTQKVDLYKKHICPQCHVKAYCSWCFRNIAERYGLGNYCYWLKKLCNNVEE